MEKLILAETPESYIEAFADLIPGAPVVKAMKYRELMRIYQQKTG